MKEIMFTMSLMLLASCSTLSESISPVAWGSGAYVAVPFSASEEEEVGEGLVDSKGRPERKISSKEEEEKEIRKELP